jgi:glycosyltransferase involved in cell wall biosynthesis
MRILHILQRDDPKTGGALRVAQALAREQRLAGHDVWHLFLYGQAGKISQEFAPHVLWLGLVSSRQAWRGVLMLWRAVRELHPDVIHCHDGIIWPRIAFLCRKAPLVMHGHLPPLEGKCIKGFLGWPFLKYTTDLLIGISNYTCNAWSARGLSPEKIRQIPNGVDLGRFRPIGSFQKRALREKLGIPAKKHILLWVGRLDRATKGTDRVERLAGALSTDTVLVVVGDGPERSGMLIRCSDLVESGRMYMPGSSPCPEIWYQAADAFLFTSYYEQFGLVILEALASGLPVLGFPVTGGGAPELLEEFNAVQVSESASMTDIANSLEVLFSRCESTRNLPRETFHKYTWQSASMQIMKAYRKLTALRRPFRYDCFL